MTIAKDRSAGQSLLLAFISLLIQGWALMLLLPLAATALEADPINPGYWLCVGLVTLFDLAKTDLSKSRYI